MSDRGRRVGMDESAVPGLSGATEDTAPQGAPERAEDT